MESKRCTKCGEKFLATEEYFYRRKDNNKFRNNCKTCHSKRNEEYRINNRDKLLQYNDKYYADNKEQLLLQKKEYYSRKCEQILNKTHKYREHNKDKVIQTRRKHYITHKDKVLRNRKEYYQKNKEQILKKDKIYKQKHKEKYREMKREFKKKRYANDLQFNLNEKISSGIRISLREGKGGRHWETLVDFSLEQLKQHLELLFKPDMTWEKFMNGEIHIDHIRPKASFNFTSPDDPDFKKCWSLNNLQPLWAEENLRKRDKWEAS